MSTPTISRTRSTDTRTLLIETGRGSVEAFAALYDEVAPLVHGVSVAALPDPESCDRVTVDVFLQLWRRAPQYDPERQEPIPWILGISYREVAAHCDSP